MKLITGGRRWGKTVRLIEAAAEDGGVIVCFSRHEADRVRDLAEKMGVTIRPPLSYDQLDRLRGMNPTSVPCHFDNADRILSMIAGAHGLSAASATWTLPE